MAERGTVSEMTNWLQKAKEGDPIAQRNLGRAYDTEKDYKEAVKWYREAADQGYAPAQSDLGLMYESGLGVEKDYKEAVVWYRKAATQGDARGQNNLGRVYEHGIGLDKDYKEAVEWYRKSADQGCSDGQNNLGLMYWMGKGVEKNLEEAIGLLLKIADGCNASSWNLGCIYKERGDLSNALRWFVRSYELGEPIARREVELLLEKTTNAIQVLQGHYAKETSQREEIERLREENIHLTYLPSGAFHAYTDFCQKSRPGTRQRRKSF